MGRSSFCEKTGLKRGTWTPEEDRRLSAYIQKYGHWNWRELPKFAGLSRCGKSCRLRWMNYLRPNIKRGNYTREEEEIIINLHEKFGNRWSAIAAKLPGRTDNEIKNHWHTHLKKRSRRSTTPPIGDRIMEAVEVSESGKESKPGTCLNNDPRPLILESSTVVSISLEKPTSSVSSSPTDSKIETSESEVTDGNISDQTYEELSGNFWTEPFQVGEYYAEENFRSSLLADPELVFPPSPVYSFYDDYGMDFSFNQLALAQESPWSF